MANIISATASDPSDLCGICRDELTEHTVTHQTNPETGVPQLARHFFHGPCLRGWLNQLAETGRRIECPYCSLELSPPEPLEQPGETTREALIELLKEDFYSAARNGDLGTVRNILANGHFNPEWAAEIFPEVAELGHTSVLRELIAHCNLPRFSFNAALVLAVRADHQTTIGELMAHGNYSRFLTAAAHGHTAGMSLALAEDDIPQEELDHALLIAGAKENIEMLLLVLPGASEEMQEKVLNTAVFNNDLSVVAILLERVRFHELALLSALRIAVQKDNVPMMRKITERKRFLPDDLAHTLNLAAREGSIRAVRELLSYDGIFQARQGWVLLKAAENDWRDVLHVLLAHGNISDQAKSQALLIASAEGHIQIVRELLLHGNIPRQMQHSLMRECVKNPNAVDAATEILKHGNISREAQVDILMEAVEDGDMQAVAALMKLCAFPQSVLQRASSIAREKDDHEMADLICPTLCKKLTDFGIRVLSGKTALLVSLAVFAISAIQLAQA